MDLKNSTDTPTADTIEKMTVSRRKMMVGAGMAGAALALSSGLFGSARSVLGATTSPVMTNTDGDILNFALNLEYLEAEYYLHAIGSGLTDAEAKGAGPVGPVIGGKKVPFAIPLIQQYAEQIADDEHKHVIDLKGLLGTRAVSRPTIDIGPAFTAAARAAGIIGPGDTFDPYANDDTFLLGAFVFEDVGVTAYHGAAPSIKNPYILDAAAGILAVEAYHAGSIRTSLLQRGQTNPFLITAANAISALRAKADGSGDNGNETPLTDGNGDANIRAADEDTAIAFSRTFNEVLRIVYLGGTLGKGGGFFPKGLNGNIR